MRLLLLAMLLFGAQLPVRNGAIAGKLLSSDGLTPTGNIRVAAISVGADAPADGALVLAQAQTDRQGAYRLSDLPAGRYVIMAGTLDRPTYYPGVGQLKDATVVSVAGGTTLEGVNFKQGVLVSGRMSGRKIVMALQTTERTDRLTTTVDPDGSFLFSSVPAGTYLVFVDAVARGRIVVGLTDLEVTPAVLSPIDPSEIFGVFVKVSSGARPFEMAQRLVTQFQWEAVMGSPPERNRLDLKGLDRPVIGAGNGGAEAFCAKLTALNDGYRYRLPTEIEYDAARALDAKTGMSNDSMRDAKLWNEAYLNRPKEPNGLGLYDMTLWEWLSDDLGYAFGAKAGSTRGGAGKDDLTAIAAFRCVREPASSQP
jgi:hypothetical protein